MHTHNTVNPLDIIPAEQVPTDPEYQHLFDAQGQWDWLLRQRDKNGLDSAILRLGGKRLYLVRSKFRRWLASRIEAA